MTFPPMHLCRMLTQWTLALSPCLAQPPVENTAAPYQGTYLFDLIDGDKPAQPITPRGVPSYAMAFKQLTKTQSRQERRFVARLTSGPSTRGALVQTSLGQAVFHTTCQAHSCNWVRMGVSYIPESGHMVGLLWDHCELLPLGSPNAEEVTLLMRLSQMPADTPENRQQCERER